MLHRHTHPSFWAVAGLTLLVACSGGGDTQSTDAPPAPTAPVITTFSAAQTLLTAGASTQITPVFAHGTGTITPGIGPVTSGTAVSVKPNETTIYTLTVTDSGGRNTTQPLIVGVNKPEFELVSLGSTGTPAESQAYLSWHTISADGRFVAFASMDGTLVPGDTNGATDIFVRDRTLGTTVCVSRASNGGSANSYSDYPKISANGRYVVFETAANNLLPDHPTRTHRDIYRHDLQTGTTVRVSVDNLGIPGNGTSESANISADGRYVVFHSGATLTPETSGSYKVYLRDMTANTTILVSRKGGAAGLGVNPSISGDGSKVVYQSWDDNLSQGSTSWQMYGWDRSTQATSLVSSDSSGTLRDGGSESTSRVVFSSISQNGRYVTFCTTSDNLVPGKTDDFQNVFVKDTQTGILKLLSQKDGVSGNEDSVRSQGGRASISGDGTWVTFNTNATNLAGGQYSTMAANIMTGETKVMHPGAGFIGDTNPFISSDTYGRFVVLRGQENLDPRYAFRGIFLKDRHVAPIAASGPNQTVSTGATVTLDGSTSRVSTNDFPLPAPALSYAWTQLSGPAAIALSSATAARPTFTASAPGTYAFKLVVNDTLEDSVPVLVLTKVQ